MVKIPREKFEAKFEYGEPDECWNWKGTIREKGYGVLTCQGKRIAN